MIKWLFIDILVLIGISVVIIGFANLSNRYKTFFGVSFLFSGMIVREWRRWD